MKKTKLFIPLLILFLILLSCRALIPSTVIPPESEGSLTPEAEIPQSEGSPTLEVETPQTGYVATASVIPPTLVTHTDPLKVLQTWFYQDKTFPDEVNFVFLVQNPNPAVTVIGTDFQVVAYDAANTILGITDAYIQVIFPTETLAAVSPFLSIKENTVVSRVEVELKNPGTPDTTLNLKIVPSGGGEGTTYSGSPFKTSNVKYYPNSSDGPQVSGTVQNIVGNVDYLDVDVTAVALDTNGKIVGASLSPFLTAIPANGTVGVVTSDIHLTGDPASWELFPTSGNSQDASQPDPVQVLRSGATQDGNSAQYGIVINNTDPLHDRMSITYTVTAFDAEGAVIGVDYKPLDIAIIFPGEQTGAAGNMDLIDNTPLARIEVQVVSEDDPHDIYNYQKASLMTNPLTAEDCNLVSGTTVTCMIKNNSPYDFSNTSAAVIAYDGAGAVIGGGNTVIDGVPANSQVAMEVDGLPAQTTKFDVYPQPDGPFTLTAAQTQTLGAATPTPSINIPTPEMNGSPSPMCDTSAYITINNTTGDQLTLNLQGPANYAFTLLPGYNQMLVCLGTYTYTATGCGGALLTGTLNSGETHEFYCSK